MGHVRDEYSLYATRLDDADDAGVGRLLKELCPTPGAQRYRAAFPSLPPDRLRETALSDWLFRMPTLHLAEAAHAGGAWVWLYELSWAFGSQGASHGLDTLLVFGTADIDGQITAAGQPPITDARHLSQSMRDEHLAFAATGDPGWAAFDSDMYLTRVYDAAPTVEPYPERRSRRLWHNRRFSVLDLPE